MTTAKVLVSSKNNADKNYLTNRAALSYSVIIALFVVGAAVMVEASSVALPFGAVAFAVAFLATLVVNWDYSKDRADFIQLISEAVEKETGHSMKRSHVMGLLFMGAASDNNDVSLMVKRTSKEVRVLLVK